MNIYDSRDTDQGRLYTSNGIWVSHKIANQLNFHDIKKISQDEIKRTF